MTMTEPRPPAHNPGDCICGGSGMVPVDEDYVHRHAAKAAAANDGEAVPGLLEALRNSVCPCYECRPTQYRLWADGCLRPGHRCGKCRPITKSKGRRRSAA